MSLDAAPQTEEAEAVQGFSRLDLVKHSMKTVTKTLKPQDYLSIITFSDRARVRLEPRKMDAGGQASASTTVDSLVASGGTNIWDALRVGVEQAKSPICAGKDVVILLLTDGEPTTNPPKGIVETLRGTLQTIESQNFTINAFGFGYNLDSLLLDQIARLGNGSFGFIPDCSMVGTIFINFLANTLATRLHNARLVVEDTPHKHVFAHTSAPNSLTVPIGSIRYGQKRTLVFSRAKTGAEKPVRVSLEAVSVDAKGVDLVAESAEDKHLQQADASMLESFVVAHAVDLLYEVALSDYSVKTKAKVASLKELIVTHVPEDKRTPLIKELLLDIESTNANEGQLEKAVSREDWFKRWGRCHLLSFCNAHRYEQCSNFKDKSLQLYGGQDFKKVQDEANNIFVSLPPPVSSLAAEREAIARYSGGGGGRGGRGGAVAAAPRKPANMSGYMDSHGICFDGEGQVAMLNGNTKQVKQLQKGDRLKSGAKIVAVVQTFTADAPVKVVEMSGVLITPWHPVLHNGVWAFPAEVGEVEERNLPAIYNLILSDDHVVEINGLSLITMGHERNEESAVLAHPFFGTKRIVQDLMAFPGWEQGSVCLNYGKIERDSNNLVCSIRHVPQVDSPQSGLTLSESKSVLVN
jgi:hypothetical protein